MTTEVYLSIITIVTILICIILVKVVLKYSNVLYLFTKKDILLFSVFSLFLLFSFIVNSVFFISSIQGKDIFPRPAYESHKLYNEVNYMNYSQDNLVGIMEMEVATQRSSVVDKSFTIIMSMFLIIMIIIIFIPLFIILLMEHFLLMLAVFNSKNVFLIKYFLYFDFLLKKIYFNLYYGNYPLKERSFIINSSGHNNTIKALNKDYEKEKEEIKLYEESMNLITKNNTLLVYEKVGSMLFLIIISFFIINLVFISYDLYNILLIKNILSLSVLASSILFVFVISKIFNFLIKYRAEHAVEFLQQKSYGDKLFLFCIITTLLMNILFFSVSLLELFGLLYIMSYSFDLIYNIYETKRIKQSDIKV